MDGTCVYTEKKDGTVVKTEFYNDPGVLEKFPNLWKDKVGIRVNCIRKLLDELEDPNFLQTTLGFRENVKLNMDKLIMMGHSMGATTTLAVCAEEPRFKGACVLDPCILPGVHTMD